MAELLTVCRVNPTTHDPDWLSDEMRRPAIVLSESIARKFRSGKSASQATQLHEFDVVIRPLIGRGRASSTEIVIRRMIKLRSHGPT
jgi:hypothetical protein